MKHGDFYSLARMYNEKMIVSNVFNLPVGSHSSKSDQVDIALEDSGWDSKSDASALTARMSLQAILLPKLRVFRGFHGCAIARIVVMLQVKLKLHQESRRRNNEFFGPATSVHTWS